MYEDAEIYLRCWYNTDDFSEYNIYLDQGYLELAADYILSSGVLDHDDDLSCEVIKLIVKRFKKKGQKYYLREVEKALKNSRIHECEQCNHCSIVDDDNKTIYSDSDFVHCWQCKSTQVCHYDYGKYNTIQYKSDFERLLK